MVHTADVLHSKRFSEYILGSIWWGGLTTNNIVYWWVLFWPEGVFWLLFTRYWKQQAQHSQHLQLQQWDRTRLWGETASCTCVRKRQLNWNKVCQRSQEFTKKNKITHTYAPICSLTTTHTNTNYCIVRFDFKLFKLYSTYCVLSKSLNPQTGLCQELLHVF